jgi:adenylylsulfate kinase
LIWLTTQLKNGITDVKENNLKMNKKVLWLTGLSGSGKSTISSILLNSFKNSKIINLDGDVLRTGLNKNLGFTDEDRLENIRRTAEVAKLFLEQNYLVICSLISPLKKQRDLAKQIIGPDKFIEIFIKCSINECIKRDPKGLYKKALENNTPNFTGLTAPYEEPTNPNIIINTEIQEVSSCVNNIVYYVLELSKRQNIINQ